MIKSVFLQIFNMIPLLSDRLKMLFRHRDVFLVDDESLLTTLASAGLSQESLKTIKCASCGQGLTVENIQAWVVLPEETAFYCSTDECVAVMTDGEKGYGSQR